MKQPALQMPKLRVVRNGNVELFGEVLADIFPNQVVLGGASFNVAMHLKAFGVNPVVITGLGRDALGGEIFEEMLQNGMNTPVEQ